MNWLDVLWVALAGSGGAVMRYLIDSAIRRRVATLIPIGTVTINLSGSLLLGLLTGLVLFHGAPSTVTLVAGTGFCGGYTTFSTASFETIRLIQRREIGAAALHGGLTLVGALLAAGAGLALGSL